MVRRRDCRPSIVSTDGTLVMPSPIPLTEQLVEEGFIQELLRKSPALLPVEEMEPTFAPLVTIGYEVDASPAGRIDLMYANPGARLTIVEVKLWRNTQALRRVVSQALDYASQLSQWSYDDIDDRVVAYNKQFRDRPMGLFETVKRESGYQDLDEAHFVDRVNTHLRRGRMLLVIAGDGIRERLETIASYLELTPNLHFSLMFLELQLFNMPTRNGDILIVPQLVARTKEVERAVVSIRDEVAALVSVEGPARYAAETRVSQRARLQVQDLLEQLEDRDDLAFVETLLADLEAMGAYPDPGVRDLMIKLPDPLGSNKPLTLLGVTPKDGSIYEDWLPWQLQDRLGITLDLALPIAREYYESVIDLLDGYEMVMNDKGDGEAWKPHIPIAEMCPKYDLFVAILKHTIERIQDVAAEQMPEG